MKILMILENEFPPDSRVEKEMISLAREGHQVDIASYTRHQRPLKEQFEYYTVYRKPINWFYFKMSPAALILPFYFMFWRSFAKKLYKENQYDVIHTHDLPLSKVGYYFKKRYKTKLVCDQHEYYSNWITHTGHYNKGIGKIIKWLSNWTLYEKKYLNKADRVVTVEQPLKECYINEVGLPEEKIVLVPNTPEQEIFNEQNVDQEIIDHYRHNFMLFYAGGIDLLRGLDIALEALIILKTQIPEVKLVIAGRQAKGFDIVNMAERLNVDDRVEYIPWIDYHQLPSYMAAAKVGFFTPPGNRDEIHNTIATKIYQYMAMGLPIIVSDVKMMKEFVVNHNIGFIARNKEEFTKSCIELYQNPELARTLNDNAKKARDKYYWHNTIKALLEHYKRFKD